jgi:hypothetical protein
MIVTTDPKAKASRLRNGLAGQGIEITRSKALELVAAQLGFRDWNTCASVTNSSLAPTTITILRIFPGVEASRFYLDFLGFAVDWEHRFGEGMPLYQQVSRDGVSAQPWGNDLDVPDPFGNRIIFHTPRSAVDAQARPARTARENGSEI